MVAGGQVQPDLEAPAGSETLQTAALCSAVSAQSGFFFRHSSQ